MTPAFLDTFRLDITPLSPVHIGSGEDLDPTAYVLDENSIFEFSAGALGQVLDSAERKKLLNLVNGATGEQVLAGIQKFVFDRKDGLIAHSVRALHATSGVKELYEKRLGTVAQSETGAINKLEIARHSSHPGTSTPVLPGSSLKGAIRTALLNRENRGRRLIGKEDSRKLQQRLLGYENFKLEKDPMRLVHVADAMCVMRGSADGFAAETAVAFAVNRKKREQIRSDGEKVRSQAERKGLYQILEVVPALNWRMFQGSISIHAKNLQHDRLPRNEFRWTADHLATACNEFYVPIFERELGELRDRGLLNKQWSVAVSRIDPKLDELRTARRAFVLRVGRHSGAESVTLDGVRNIRITTPRGQPKRFENEATTWWLASDHIDANANLLPFGWVLIEMTADGRPPPACLEIATPMQEFRDRSGEPQWVDKALRHRAEMLKQSEERTAKREAAEERQRKKAEQERRRQDERARLTDEERRLDDLRHQLDAVELGSNKSQGQGGLLAQNAVQLLKDASNWPKAPRLQAADLVETIYRTIGYPKSKKGRERKQQIAALREGTDVQ